jgi:hypothetical protein
MRFRKKSITKKSLVGNSQGIMILSGANSNWVVNSRKQHVVQSGVDFSCIQVKYINWATSTNSEQQGYHDWIIRSGLTYQDKSYRFTFGGKIDYLLSKTYGEVWSDPLCGVSLKAGDNFYINTRQVAADAGAAGTYTHIWNTGGTNSRQDGVIYSTDPTIDLTMDAGICSSHHYGKATVNGSGNITAANITSAGINCTAGLPLFAYCGAAGCDTPGALNPGSGWGSGGYCVNSGTKGGQISAVYDGGNQGNDYSSANPPIFGCGGSGTLASGFGTNTSLYTAAAVVGIPSKPVASALLFGNSNVAGFSAVDGIGNINGSHGMYQQALDTVVGTMKLAITGETAGGWNGNSTRQKAFLADMVANGVQFTHVINNVADNDFLGNLNTDVIAATSAAVSAQNSYFRTLFGGAKIYLATISPQVAAAGGTTDPTTISPYNANYTFGGNTAGGSTTNVEIYNNQVRAMAYGNDGVIDTDALIRDPNNARRNLPRTDLYPATSRSCTTTSGSAVVTVASTANLYPSGTVGVAGTGIPTNTTISIVARNTSFTMNKNATASGAVTCTFTVSTLAGDGVHWSVAAGIPWLVQNKSTLFPAFTVP